MSFIFLHSFWGGEGLSDLFPDTPEFEIVL